MTKSSFYLGRVYDPNTQSVTDQKLEYDAGDLTTHAVVTGMTGSGKTGLCVALLEEAALDKIPAIIIDPKGDLTNLLLHFPELATADFQPWIDSQLARRSGRSLEQVAEEAAASWRKGLEEWDIPQERLQQLKDSVEFAVYTPGSDSGIPVSVLSSMAAPELPDQSSREVLREKITSTVTALLGLVGYQDVDPLRSREHILLSNIFENAWGQGKDLELTELILQTQSPPFDKLGAFSVESLFPAKDRAELAMVLNNILAAPAFERWRHGQRLNIDSILKSQDGRPRHSVFYLAHLPENERMFFVTLLLSEIETWMRAQSGATSLRAVVYMDEILGYFPPISNPSSKPPLLRMIKQGRAFGVGLVLATQNPSDIDYKGLSNAGTWFIGKLQTEQDKARLLDGLDSAAGGSQRAELDRQISTLAKRVFILHNIHSGQPQLFQSRWAMNFLAGPLSRNRIGELNELAEAKRPVAAVMPAVGATGGRKAPRIDASVTKPPVPASIREYYLPQNNSVPEAFSAAGRQMPAGAKVEEAVIYRPALLASAQVRIVERKHGVDSEITRAALVPSPERRGTVRWDEYVIAGSMLENVDTAPVPSARYAALDSPLNDAKLMNALQKDFSDWVYRNSSVTAKANKALKVFAGPDVSQAEFMKASAEAAREGRDAEIAKKTAQLDRKIKTLEDRLAREERELTEDQVDYEHRKWEERGNLAELGAGLIGFGRKKSLSSHLSKRRMTEKAKAEVEESVDSISQFKEEIADLQRQRDEAIAEINDRWGNVVNETSELTLTPKKTDVFVNLFGVAWLPHYLIRTDDGTEELPAYNLG